MSIEERILNDNSCSPYVDKGRGYVEIAFKDGAYWGYEQGCKDMIDKACEWLKTYANDFGVPESESGRVYVDDLVAEFREAMKE